MKINHLLLAILALLFLVNQSNAIGVIDQCQNITISDNYVLTQDISKDNTGHNICIDIQISDVILDCNSYSIFPTQTIPTNQIGIKANTSNVELKNCNLLNYNASELGAISIIGATYINNITISDSTVTNSLYSLEYVNVNGSTVSNFNFTYLLNTNNEIGISLTDVQNSTFSNINSYAQSAIANSYFNFYIAFGSSKNLNFTDINSNLSIGLSALFRGSNFLEVNLNRVYGNLTGCVTCEGISDFADSNFTIQNTQINATSSAGGVAFSVGQNSNATLTNVTLSGTSNAVYMIGASTINFTDLIISNGNLTNRQGANLTFTNTSISPNNITTITDESTNTYFIQPINITVPADATVNVSNYSLQTNYSATNGFALFNITALIYNSSGTFNYTTLLINANTTELFAETTTIINAPYNGNYQQITPVQFTVNQCTSLQMPGIYTLSQNISQTIDKCINITTDDVTLNCQGYWINSGSENAQYSIYTDQFNTTINNCGFSNYIQNQTSYVIYSAGNNLTVYNSTFYNSTGGIQIDGGAQYVNISTNTFNLLNYSAMDIQDSGAVYANISNNRITNITLGTALAALYSRGFNSTFNSNTIINVTGDFGSTGMRIDSQYQVIYNNTLTGVAQGIYATSCISCGYFQNVSYNNVNSSSASVTLGSYSIIQANIVNSSIVAHSVENSTIFDNIFLNIGGAVQAIYFSNVNNTNVYRNTVLSYTSSQKAIYNSQVNQTTYYNNNFTNATGAFHLITSNVTIINSTFNLTGNNVDASSTLTYKVPVRITTINDAAAALTSVALTITNNSATLASGTSNATGYLDVNVTALLYNFSATPLNYSDSATITGTKNGYDENSTTMNLTAGEFSDYQTVTLMLTATPAAPGGSGGSGGGGGGGSGGAASSSTVNTTQNETQSTASTTGQNSQTNKPTNSNVNQNTQANETDEKQEVTENQEESAASDSQLPIIPIGIAVIVIGAIGWFTIIRKPPINMPKPN